jgi:hypothetical protein
MNAIKDETTGRWSLEGVEDSVVTYERILRMLQTKEPFSFARYGDGEFNAIMGKPGMNCDGHSYFADMGARLKAILNSEPKYMVGIQPLTVSQFRYNDYWKHLNIPWVNADCLHNASIDEKLGRFFDVLKTRKVLLVGPKHLEFFKAAQIVIPNINCWTEYRNIRSTIYEFLTDKKDWVVLFCASMMSEVLIDDFDGSQNTFIDLGSALDVYAGKISRSYHKLLKL